MTDVAQALQIPTVFPEPNPEGLLSALLVWDRVLIPTGVFGCRSESLDRIVQRLEDEGACQRVDLPNASSSFSEAELKEAVKAATADFDLSEAEDRTRAAGELGARATVAAIASWIAKDIQAAVDGCAHFHAAPLASGPLSHLSAALPPNESGSPTREGRLISAAVQGLAVGPGTSVEDILKFRDDYAALRGRFRAAMVDLADTLSNELSLGGCLAEADAVVSNRVTPALGDLDRALGQSRISYFWQALLVGSAAATGPVSPGVATSGAAAFVTHSLAYAFNRKRLIAEHPFGLLYAARQDFPAGQIIKPLPVNRPITDPASEIRRRWQIAIEPVLPAIGEAAALSAKENKSDSQVAIPPQLVRLLNEGIERAKQEG